MVVCGSAWGFRLVSAAVDETDLGRFVVGDPAQGVGRLVGVDGLRVRIRYFRGPSEDPYVERSAELAQVAVAPVRRNTRVYFHDGCRWRIGRVDAEDPGRDGQYIVAFPNGAGETLSQDEFDIRWSNAVEDPYAVLASVGVESPVVYEPRIDLIAAWHRQRASAAGVEGLLLGSVELHDHQVRIVRGVTNDSNRRYLLADEVGLGKTVEAGALVWRALRDLPNAEVLVLVPGHLRQQWAEELTGKFHVGAFSDAVIRIRAHEDTATWPSGPVDVLVVDEAHHFTDSGPFCSDALDRAAGLAHGASNVFLLSATPVRSNEAAFLDLLHLLDPKNYRREDLDSFTRRVEVRDEVALIHLSLGPDLDEFDFSLYADQLRLTFPDDEVLSLLVGQAEDSTDLQRPERIGRVRDHLSETYRLHHRLLRTRRSAQIKETFGVRGRSRGRPFTVDIDDDSDQLRVDLIEGFRQHLAEVVECGEVGIAQAVEALKEVGQACGSLPQAILGLISEDASGAAPDLARNWLASMGDALRRDLEGVAPVILDSTVRKIGALTISRDIGKVVVSSGYPAVAVAVAAAMEGSFGGHRLATHLAAKSQEENAADVTRWRSDELCRVLICDASAEEGLNLQAADAYVHLNLPWEVFRLEQRIGRADRFVRGSSEPVKSMVLAYGDQPYALGWFLFAADTCGVFDGSVSSLQYVLADLESDVLRQVILGGAGVLGLDIEERRDGLDGERRRISAHDSLDSVTGIHEDLDRRFLREDADPGLANALRKWLVGVGAEVLSPVAGSMKVSRRRRLQVPFPLELAIAPWFERELALSRDAAVERRLEILRPGHGLLDHIVRHLVDDDRGIAFAFMRPVQGCWPPIPVFRTDFLVKPAVGSELTMAAEVQGVSSWLQLQLDALIPPVLETVYTSDTGPEIEIPGVSGPYDKKRGDRNLGSRPELFDRLSAHLDWTGVCGEGLRNATEILAKRESVGPRAIRSAEALASAIEEDIATLQRRASVSLESVGNDLAAFEALAAAVPDALEIDTDVIGCGVIILADSDRLVQ